MIGGLLLLLPALRVSIKRLIGKNAILKVQYQTMVDFQIKNQSFEQLAFIVPKMPIPIDLGTDWCHRHNIIKKFGNPRTMEIAGEEIQLKTKREIEIYGF